MTEQSRDFESGFTLLEMVISVVILALITGAISAALVTSLNASSATKYRVRASQDSQLISAFFARDAQALGGSNPALGTDDSNLGVTLTPGLANNGCDAPGTPLIGFKWIDRPSGTIDVANYSYVATATGAYQPQQLLRTVCGTAAGTSVLASNVVTIATGTSSAPVAWCDNNQAPPGCPASPPFPKAVNMALTILSTSDNVTTPYPFTLNASVRPQSGAQPDLSTTAPITPMLLLGGSAACGPATINLGSPSIKPIHVFGQVFVNAGCSGTAAQVNGSFVATGGVASIQGTSCSGVTCTPYPAAITDPYANLALPSANCQTGAHGVGTTVYTGPNPVSWSTVPGPGVYVFCHGLNASSVNDSPPPGVLLYFAGLCSKQAQPCVNSFNSSNDTFHGDTSTFFPQAVGTYAGIVLWQAVSNNNQLEVSGASAGSGDDLEGLVYAPGAVIHWSKSTTMKSVIAAGISAGSGGAGGTTAIGTFYVASPATLPNGTKSQTYTNTTVQATGGGGGPYTWGDGGTLPPGLSIGLNSGVISGTPNTAGTYTVTITATNSLGDPATFQFPAITIFPALTISGTLPTWTVNQPGYPANPLTASGGTGGFAWSSPDMPPGLTLNANGSISGPPNSAGSYTTHVTIIDSSSNTFTQTFNPVVINPLPKVNNVVLSGGTAGKIEKNDTIVITFSQAMNPATFCAGWNGAPTLNGIATVNDGVSPGPPNDNVAIASAGCVGGLKAGTIDLKSFTYVTGGSATFGASGTASTITLTGGGTVLTIKLGNAAGGLVGINQTSTPVYSASPGVTDTTGAGLSSPTFTLPNAKQF